MLAISSELMSLFCKFLENKFGFHFPEKEKINLKRKLSGIVKALGGQDNPEGCIRRLLESVNEEELALLAQHLTIGETYFFRDEGAYKVLEHTIFPELIRQRRTSNKLEIKIWCAGCATGEEPYSLAIVLHRLIPDISSWKISILGTDINDQFLKKAKMGQYKKWSFRCTPPEVKECYFIGEKEGREWTVIPQIRSMVEFGHFNLATSERSNTFNSSFKEKDLILCNNVLIYFSPSAVTLILKKIAESLSEGGWLLVSSIEVPFIKHNCLIPHTFGNTILFKKETFVNEEEEGSTISSLLKEPFRFIEDEPVHISVEDLRPVLEEISVEPSKTPTFEMQELERLYQIGNYREVSDALEEICRTQNLPEEKRYNAILLLIKAYANQRMLTLAERWCQNALKLNSMDPILHCLHARVREESNDIAQAIISLKKALYIDSGLIIAHFALGCLFERQLNTKEADRSFRNALQQLNLCKPEDVLPGTDGILAGSLVSIIEGRPSVINQPKIRKLNNK